MQQPKVRRFKAEKLVRDKMVDTCKAAGVRMVCRVLEGTEYVDELKRKMCEEALEVAESTSTEECVQELADVLEVIHALAQACGHSFEAVERYRIAKREERGGFERRLYCSHFEVDETSHKLAYYVSKPEHYPEIE